MVKRLDVEFQSEGDTIRGWLYTPDDGARHPTVVLAGGWCYVREVTMPTYADVFAQGGYNALIIDYRNLGASGGKNRQHLDPWAQIGDYQNAISFLERHPAVDPNKIGAWGISYSGGHVIILAALDERVKTVVSHVPVIDGYETMRRIHGVNGWRQLQKLVSDDRALRYERPGEQLYLPHATIDYVNDIPSWPVPEAEKVFRDIKDLEAPLYQNKSTVESVALLLRYDVTTFVKRIINTPVMMVVAEGDDITMWDMEIAAFNAISCPRKELVTLPHTTHMTLYSNKSRTMMAAQSGLRWLNETLR
jgi:uncharacterized protein